MTQVRRAYKKLLTKSHPDKGGNAEHFASIQKAYKVLSTPEQVSVFVSPLAAATLLPTRMLPLQKRIYDETGKVHQSAEQQFAETFGNGIPSSSHSTAR